MFAGVTFIALLCFAGTPRVFMQKVGETCTENGGECTGTVEKCSTGLKCECADNHINRGSKTCISNDCTAAAAATTCNALPNFACVSNVCKCNTISAPVTTDGATKGTCEIKTCTANAGCTDTETNSECSSGSCACTATYEVKAGVCALKVYGDSCTSNANCAGIHATEAVCDTTATSPVCKKAVGVACTAASDCVSNAECDSTSNKCACAANYETDSTGKLCVSPSGAGMIAASFGALLFALFLQSTLL